MSSTRIHESPLRRMIADSRGGTYESLRSLVEALAVDDTAVVMQGDDGGSIYLTCPTRLVRCDEATLRQLLLDIDQHYWKDPTMVGLYFERAPVGAGIAGGTGGGLVTTGVWLHPELEAQGLREDIEAVIFARGSR